MQIAEQKRLELNGMDDDFRAEIAYRRLRLAHAQHNVAEEKQQVAALKLLSPSHSNSGVDAIETLRKLGYNDEASELFKRTYERASATLAANPNDPVFKNDLAWLCARSGEHLEEALDLAKQAVAAEPNSGSFTDTLAEAHFRLGHAAEAVRLETRALELRPDDDFLREQLERFKRR
jgi:tetratricopeptide (TPR) repeat protein